MAKELLFVNVYEVTRHYGGPEEGGWWYNWMDCLETYPTSVDNADTVKDWLHENYKDIKHGDIYSVRGGTDLAIIVESTPARSQTKERPYYE